MNTKYNGELYLAQCINSVLNHTYYFIYLIISDNNSTDDTVKIANSLLSNTDIDNQIINNKSSLGIADNWNNAIQR